MENKKKAQELVQYIFTNRGVGHTETIINGALATKALVICHSREWADELRRKGADAIVFDNPHKLRGLQKPIAIDNHELALILEGLLHELEKAEQKIESLKRGYDKN